VGLSGPLIFDCISGLSAAQQRWRLQNTQSKVQILGGWNSMEFSSLQVAASDVASCGTWQGKRAQHASGRGTQIGSTHFFRRISRFHAVPQENVWFWPEPFSRQAVQASCAMQSPIKVFLRPGRLGCLGPAAREIWARSSYVMMQGIMQEKVIKRIIMVTVNASQSEMWFRGAVHLCLSGLRLCNLHQQYSTKSQGWSHGVTTYSNARPQQ